MRKVGFRTSQIDKVVEAAESVNNSIEMFTDEMGTANEREIILMAEILREAAARYVKESRAL
jgi:hypothetical protein